jgi:hypothetical protein
MSRSISRTVRLPMTSSGPADSVSKPRAAPSKDDHRPQHRAVVHPLESLLDVVEDDRLGD